MKLFKSYWKPTPVKWRKIGDSLLVIGTSVSSIILLDFDKYQQAFGSGLKIWLAAGIVFTVVGKLATNFVSAPENPQ